MKTLRYDYQPLTRAVSAFGLFLSLALMTFIFTGCESVRFGGQSTTDLTISPMQTFAVMPSTGAHTLIMATYPDKVRSLTSEAISKIMEKKGYLPAVEGEDPDFTVSSQWIVSTQNNPSMMLAGGSPSTMEQLSPTIQVASIEVYVNAGRKGGLLWRNSSPWPFDVRSATEADIENSVAWALDSFPVQQSHLTPR